MTRVHLPKVIGIEQEKGRKRSRRILLDSGDIFSLTEDIFFQNHFSIDDSLSDVEIKKLRYKDEIAQIRNSALNLLSYRKRSKSELNRRLKEKGFAEENITETLEYLEEKKYLDDKDFAESFSRDKVRQSRIGPVKLAIELKKHGIGADTIQHVSDVIYFEFPIPEMIKHLINKKRYNLLEQTEKNQCIRFLQGKGYTFDQIFSEIKSSEIS